MKILPARRKIDRAVGKFAIPDEVQPVESHSALLLPSQMRKQSRTNFANQAGKIAAAYLFNVPLLIAG